ncbi:MAG: hypothetical protein HZT40_17755 [Candidatus Thiothrix singaporensis]|uniref:Uncharacterized protein n=1 Tax=Candidatus Thiothrix singaporensis TaxID=2799669 RepID=A0A7L6AVT0_9GAMM|nr:MAG: hypothetical protein HZT40_17755 [Candidatus Thiothrix singaporensis]
MPGISWEEPLQGGALVMSGRDDGGIGGATWGAVCRILVVTKVVSLGLP